MPRSSRFFWLLIAFCAVCLVAAPLALRWLLWQWEQNPLLRGRELAREAGCVACHFPLRGVEIPNPGSRWAVVPRFEAGNAMMYVESQQEIEEFIRFGAPLSWISSEEASTRLENQRIRMPAYEDRLSEEEIELLTNWASVVEAIDLAGDELAARGRQLSREHGCVSCHGIEGAGGRPNPRSLGGFVPGFLGANFTHLVENRGEFDEWVKTGTLERLVANPLVRRAWRRQTIAMPAYEDLSDADLDALWAWVEAARDAYGR